MRTLLRIGQQLLDADMLVDQQLMAEQTLNREFDRNIDIAVQLDEWDSMWYNSIDKAA